MRRFAQAVEERADALEELTPRKVRQRMTPREARFAGDIAVLARETMWIKQTGQFPNGKPLNAQHPQRVGAWETFLVTFNRLESGEASGPQVPPIEPDPAAEHAMGNHGPAA